MKRAFIVCVLALAVGVMAASFSGHSWQKKTRGQKLASLWDKITGNTKSGSFPSAVGLGGLFLESMDTTFDTVADEMPNQGLFNMFTRKKLIHSVGGIGKCSFQSAGGHPYTGLFKGADSMLCRLSYAKKPSKTGDKRVAVGMALKFLRNGHKSANFMAMWALDGQHEYDFFAHDVSSNVPFPSKESQSGFSGLATKALLAKFETASKWPTMLGLSDVAAVDQNGNAAADPKFPWRLQFTPSTNVKGIMSDDPDGKSIAENLKAIPTGVMYHVFAQSQPDPTGTNKYMTYIGDLKLDASMTPSEFGDETLFFQHQRKEDDLKIVPAWEAGAQQCRDNQQKTDFHFPDCTNMNTCV